MTGAAASGSGQAAPARHGSPMQRQQSLRDAGAAAGGGGRAVGHQNSGASHVSAAASTSPTRPRGGATSPSRAGSAQLSRDGGVGGGGGGGGSSGAGGYGAGGGPVGPEHQRLVAKVSALDEELLRWQGRVGEMEGEMERRQASYMRREEEFEAQVRRGGGGTRLGMKCVCGPFPLPPQTALNPKPVNPDPTETPSFPQPCK
jgi:hypothetical protein